MFPVRTQHQPENTPGKRRYLISIMCVSTYNQTIANTEISGTEANMPAITELRLAISAMVKISTNVIIVLIV